MLAADTLGTAGHIRAVLAHGFTQNSRCWGPFGDRIAARCATVAVDAPGHGNSYHDDADLPAAGQLITQAGQQAHYLGYSMGGRMLLRQALDDPASMRSLVLIGATAGIADADERGARRRLDHDRAAAVRRIGTAAFVDRWLQTPLFAELSREQSCHDARLMNRAEGLAASLEHCGTGSMDPLWDRLGELDVPVLVIAGSRDAKFTALAHRLVDGIGANAEFVSIDAGHAVHLEAPAATATAVLTWWDRIA